MANTLKSVTATSPGAAAIVTNAGGPDGAPPVTIAAFQNADVLIVAVPHGLVAGGGSVGVPARRPVRPQLPAGWAPPVYTAVAKKTGQPAAPSAPKKTTSSKTTSSTSASKSTSKSSSTTKPSGPLAFLDDKNLSVEEKLFKFLCYVADKNDKALEKKLEEISGKQKGSTGAAKSSSSSGGKGFLGNLLGGGGGILGFLGGKGGVLGPVLSAAGLAGDVLKGSGLLNLVSQASGPVLAAGASALGFPMLAPALMKAGPALVNGAMGLVDEATGGAKAASSSSTSSSSGSKEPDISQKDLMELQRLQDKQKEAFGMISNMLRSMHETKMAVISNLRA